MDSDTASLPAAVDYAASKQIAVTKEWCRGWDDARALASRPVVAQPVAVDRGLSEATDAMIAAYLMANDEYWRKADEVAPPIGRWRAGTSREATRVSLNAALAASAPSQAEPPKIDEPWAPGCSVRVGRDNADCIDLVFVSFMRHEFQMYPNEAKHLRDLLNHALPPTPTDAEFVKRGDDGRYTAPEFEYAWEAYQAAHEAGRQLGMSQANALWEMAAFGQEQEREPILWCIVGQDGKPKADLVGTKTDCEFWRDAEGQTRWTIAPPYLATPQPAAEWVALTDEQINLHVGPDEGDREAVTEIVRQVERLHGIGARQ